MGQLIVNGLALGSIYALVALGLLMIFNTVQIVNFAQGQLLMLGAFIGISGAVAHELPIATAWAITMVAMAIIGISSIHLLRTFIEAGSLGSAKTNYTETGVMWQTIIHGLFILSAIGIAYVDKLGQPDYDKKQHH